MNFKISFLKSPKHSNLFRIVLGPIDMMKAFRKLLLYPTELRRHSRSNIFQYALTCTAFCLFFNHVSCLLTVLHKIPAGKPLGRIGVRHG